MRIGRGLPIGGAGALVLLLVMWLLGADPGQLLMLFLGGGGGSASASAPASAPRSAAENEAADFVSVVLASTEYGACDTFGGQLR